MIRFMCLSGTISFSVLCIQAVYQVGLGEFGEVGITTEPDQAADSKPNNIDIVHNPSDIDHFMVCFFNLFRKLLVALPYEWCFLAPAF